MKKTPKERNDTLRFQTDTGPGSLTVERVARYLTSRAQYAVLGASTNSGKSGYFILFGPSIEKGRACRFLLADQTDPVWMRVTLAAVSSLYAEQIRSFPVDGLTPKQVKREFDHAYRWFNTWARLQDASKGFSSDYAPTPRIRAIVMRNHRKGTARFKAFRARVEAGQVFGPETDAAVFRVER